MLARAGGTSWRSRWRHGVQAAPRAPRGVKPLGRRAGRRKDRGAGGRKGRARGREERVHGDTQGPVMMEAAPAPPYEMIQPQFVLELLIVALDAPPQLGEPDEL